MINPLSSKHNINYHHCMPSPLTCAIEKNSTWFPSKEKPRRESTSLQIMIHAVFIFLKIKVKIQVFSLLALSKTNNSVNK